jgi:hypothetical protein
MKGGVCAAASLTAATGDRRRLCWRRIGASLPHEEASADTQGASPIVTDRRLNALRDPAGAAILILGRFFWRPVLPIRYGTEGLMFES